MQSLWMLLASLVFAAMGACVKIASEQGAPLAYVVLFRGVPSVLMLAGWALATRRTLAPRQWRPHLWRNLAGVSSMWLGFYAISHLPLPTAVSLSYTAPLFIAVWMLGWGGTQRDPLRIIAVAAGFLGVLAVLRPSIAPEQFLAASLGLSAGGLSAMAMMQIRQLGRLGEAEWRTVLLFSVAVCLSSVPGLAVEGVQTLPWRGWLALVGIGLFGLIGQLALTRAFGQGSPLLTAALQYTTIIFAALLGMVIWDDIPDYLAWGGMALIIISGLLSIWRTHSEDKLLRGEGRAPAPAAASAPTSTPTPKEPTHV